MENKVYIFVYKVIDENKQVYCFGKTNIPLNEEFIRIKQLFKKYNINNIQIELVDKTYDISIANKWINELNETYTKWNHPIIKFKTNNVKNNNKILVFECDQFRKKSKLIAEHQYNKIEDILQYYPDITINQLYANLNKQTQVINKKYIFEYV